MLAPKSHRSFVFRPLAIVLAVLLSAAQNLGLSATEEFLLTGRALVHFTNVARRSTADLRPLAEAPDLNSVAEARLKDMFGRQYFSHTSPATREGAPEIADRIGYRYLAIAENIARGSFVDDQDMVRVWMESSRHRQNIVSPGYTEIGAAAGRGMLDGQLVWIGVQVFARPLSDCPQPDAGIVTRIESLKFEAATVKNQAAALQAHLRAPDRRNRGEVTLYNGRAIEYNVLIARHNALADEVRRLIALHNLQTDRLGSCVSGPLQESYARSSSGS